MADSNHRIFKRPMMQAHELEVPPMAMLTIRHEDVRAIENAEFHFIPQERDIFNQSSI